MLRPGQNAAQRTEELRTVKEKESSGGEKVGEMVVMVVVMILMLTRFTPTP